MNKGDKFEVTYGKFRHGRRPGPWNMTIEMQEHIPLPVFGKSDRVSNESLLSFYGDETISSEIFESILSKGSHTNVNKISPLFNEEFKNRFGDSPKRHQDISKDISSGFFSFLGKNKNKEWVIKSESND